MIRWILFHILVSSFVLIPLASQAAISEEYSGNRPTLPQVQVVSTKAPSLDARAIVCQSKTNLGFGSRGYEVKALQTFLGGSGFGKDLVPATGYFGPLTKLALFKYQKTFGLKLTGNLSAETRVSFCK